ncbi:unnamed protein product [Tenebrio molitor]|nr:unnamed protein product [Tenebrio molitor]
MAFKNVVVSCGRSSILGPSVLKVIKKSISREMYLIITKYFF